MCGRHVCLCLSASILLRAVRAMAVSLLSCESSSGSDWFQTLAKAPFFLSEPCYRLCPDPLVFCLAARTSHHPMNGTSALPAVDAVAAAGATSVDVPFLGASAAPIGDLLILGAGTLGTLVAARWLAAAPSPGSADAPVRVVAETLTRKRHDRLAALGAVPRTRAEADAVAAAADTAPIVDSGGNGNQRFPYVVFSMPPSASDDYTAEAARAVASWAGPASGGRLVFTSSTSALAEKGGATITETAPTTTGRVTGAEGVIREAGGVVVRIGGLHARRVGQQLGLVGKPSLTIPRQLIINMVHYEDAAAAVVAAARLPLGAPTDVDGSPFVVTDGVPLTVEELVAATMAHTAFAGSATPALPVDTGVCGKRIDAIATREALAWEPRYTYTDFWRESGDDKVDS